MLGFCPGASSTTSQYSLAFEQAALALGESDVHSDICINAFLTTAFCLLRHHTKVELFQKIESICVPRAKNSPGLGAVSYGSRCHRVCLTVGALGRFGWTVQERDRLPVSEYWAIRNHKLG